jgi:hypothetical protein
MKQSKKLVFQGYSYTPDCEEIFTTIELHMAYGGVRVTVEAVAAVLLRDGYLTGLGLVATIACAV